MIICFACDCSLNDGYWCCPRTEEFEDEDVVHDSREGKKTDFSGLRASCEAVPLQYF